MTKKNYIRLNRSILNHWVWPTGTYTQAEAWLWLLMNAAHSQHKKVSDGKFHIVEVGEMLYSTSKLAEAWGWGRKRTANFLEMLKKDQMIDTGECTRYDSRLRVNNYAAFQGKNQPIGTDEDAASGAYDVADDDSGEEHLAPMEPIQEKAKDTPLIKGEEREKKKNKYTIPSDFSCTDEMTEWVEVTFGSTNWIDLHIETKMFVSYWQDREEKRPGWLLTWKNHIKRLWDKRKTQVGTPKHQIFDDIGDIDPMFKGAL